MKKVLRSLVVLGAVLASTTVGTLGYFSSSAQATNNLIQTGTLQVNVGSSATGNGNQGYWVNLGGTQVGNFPDVTNAAPGVPFYIYAVVANGGTLPFDYRATVAPYNAGGCPQGWYNTSDVCEGALSASMIDVLAVHRFQGNPGADCEGDQECLDIYTWLTLNNGYNMVGALLNSVSPSQPFGHPNTTTDGSFTLNVQNDYSVFRIQAQLEPGAGNEYQNKRFRYTLNVNAKQTNAPTF